MRDLQELVFVLDTARAGNHAHFFAAGAGSVFLVKEKGDNRPLLLDFLGSHLVGSEDRHRLVHSLHRLENGAVFVAIIPNDGHHRPLGALDHVVFHSHFPHELDDMVDLLLSRAGFHDDDHWGLQNASSFPAKRKSPRTASRGLRVSKTRGQFRTRRMGWDKNIR